MKNRLETAREARAALRAAEAAEAAALRKNEAARAAAVDAVRALRAAEAEAVAARLEETAPAAAEAEAAARHARADYLSARAALRAEDAPALDGEELRELCARSITKAIRRRERDTAQNAAILRQKYAEDAEQETAARLLGFFYEGEDGAPAWIDGAPVMLRGFDGEAHETARAALPLSYVAAVAAGRALDALIYADGGRFVKLSAREARKHYADAPEIREATEALEAAEAAAEEAAEADKAEALRAVKAARAELSAACGNVAAARTASGVTETRRTSSPVAPSPEAAALRVELYARMLCAVPEKLRKNAARLLWARFVWADSTREAARGLKLSEATARRTWDALKEAAQTVAEEDGEARRALCAAERNEERRHAVELFRESAAAARHAEALRAACAEAEAPGAVKWTASKKPAARHAAAALRGMSYEDRLSNYSDFAFLARLLWASAAD